MDEPLPESASFGEVYRHALSGDDMGRFLGLTDGVFAFAITLLVVNLLVPLTCETQSEESCLLTALGKDEFVFLAYTISFFVIGIWWVQHHAIFRYIARYDPALMWANMLFLLAIAVTPFILGLFANFFGVEAAVAIFALVQAAAGFLLAIVWEVAVRADLLRPEATPAVISVFRKQGLIIPVIFLVSAGVSTLSVYAAHFIWIAVFVEILYLQLAATRLRTHRHRKSGAPAAPGG